MKKQKQTINLPATEIQWLNHLCTMTGKEIYNKYGFKRDEVITYGVRLPQTNEDELEIDIKLVICEENETPYCEAVLFNHGSEMCYTEISDSINGPWEVTYKGITYIAEIEPTYPTLEAINKIKNDSELCGRFLQFLQKKYAMFEKQTKREEPYYIGSGDYINTEHLLAEFFSIDLTEAEKEKQLLLEQIRNQTKP